MACTEMYMGLAYFSMFFDPIYTTSEVLLVLALYQVLCTYQISDVRRSKNKSNLSTFNYVVLGDRVVIGQLAQSRRSPF